MPSRRVPIQPPLLGLSENEAFTEQEAATSREERNMRSIDPGTGRLRSSQRSGLSQYAGNNQVNGSSLIKSMAAVVQQRRNVTYNGMDGSDDFTPNWSRDLNNGDTCADLRVDDFGNFYALTNNDAVYKYNADGALLATISIPTSVFTTDEQPPPACLEVDEFQNVYVGRGIYSGNTEQTNAKIYGFEFKPDGTYQLGWTISPGEYVQDLAYLKGGLLYAATADTLTDQTGSLRIYDIAVPGGTGVIDFVEEPRELKTLRVDVNDAANSSAYDAVYPTRMALREDGIVYIAQTSIGAPAGAPAVGEESRLTKVNPDIENEIVWAIDTYDGGGDTGGIGMGVALGPKDSSGRYTIYSVGADVDNSATTDATAIRRIVDDGSSAIVTGGETWTASLAADFPAVAQPEAARLRLAADTDGTLYVPSSDNSDSCVLIFEKDGTLIGGDGQIGAASAGGAILNVAVPKTKPTYDSSIPLTEFVVYGGTADTSNDALFRVDVVSTTQVANLAPRSLSIIATTADGALRLITDSGVQTPATADEGPATSTIATSAPYVSMVPAFERVYITDSQRYYVYTPGDPADAADYGTLDYWRSSKAGDIPPRCRLAELWRGRMVLARDIEAPSLWHMSAVGDPTDWDNFPTVISAKQAISAENGKAFQVPDVVNSLCPYNDDLLLFGGDRSIYQLTGDPMAGGQLDLVTDETGMAFGKPWTKDPQGTLWFLGSRGSLYAMAPGSRPQRVSRDRIERRLHDIDFGANYVRLVYNYIDEGVHILVFPFNAGGTLLEHFFYCTKTNSFHPDRFGTATDTSVQPTAALLIDGDAANDRTLLLGCEDGRIRKWGRDSDGLVPKSDDSVAIDAFATIGPLSVASDANAADTQFTEFTATLAEPLDGCNFEFFATDTPDDLGDAKFRGSIRAGRNPNKLVRLSGENIYLRLRNASLGQRFSVERLSIMASLGGDQRRRKT